MRLHFHSFCAKVLKVVLLWCKQCMHFRTVVIEKHWKLDEMFAPLTISCSLFLFSAICKKHIYVFQNFKIWNYTEKYGSRLLQNYSCVLLYIKCYFENLNYCFSFIIFKCINFLWIFIFRSFLDGSINKQKNTRISFHLYSFLKMSLFS